MKAYREDILAVIEDDDVRQVVSYIIDDIESDVNEIFDTLDDIKCVRDLHRVEDALGFADDLKSNLY